MKQLLHLVLGIALILIYHTSEASFYYFRHYQVDEGLAHNNVTAIVQDKLGFIWIGTRAGLNRYDGYTFRSYSPDKGKAGSNYIKILRTDNQGNIWIGTTSGIFKMDPASGQISAIGPLSNFNVKEMLVDSKNNLWIVAAGALHQFDPNKGTIQTYNIPVAAIDIDAKDNLWIATVQGQLKLLKATMHQISDLEVGLVSRSGNRNITKLRLIKNYLFVGTTYGMFKIDLNSRKCHNILLKDLKGTEIFVRDIVASAKKEWCYVASESGLYIYNLENQQIIHVKKTPADPYSLNDNAIYSVLEDKREGVWLGTFFGGLNYFSKENNQFEKYYPLNIPGAISGNAVREICEDEKGTIWIGTEDAGLNKFDRTTGKFIQIPYGNPATQLSHHNIHGLSVYNNKLYVGLFFHGLEVMNLSNNKIVARYPQVPTDGKSSTMVMCIYKTSDNRLLVGTTGAGLFEYHERSGQLSPVIYIPGNSFVNAIEEDHTGTIWTGSLIRGVFYYNPRTGESGNINFSGLKDSTKNTYTVQGIYEDTDYNIWLATEAGGLFKINRQRQLVKRYTTAEGLPSNSLYRILEDSNKNLWISSMKGLICFNTRTETIKTYTKANGLITDQFNFNSAYKDQKGKMYFGTVKGMIAFQPEQLLINREAPPVYITGIFINYETPKSFNYEDPIIMNDEQSTFSIEFASLDYSSASAVQYKYKMEGLDKKWVHLATNRRAYFTDVPAGTYKFTVQAQSNLGYWVSTPVTLIITVLPPFWKSTAAVVIYILAGILVIVLIFYIYHKNQVKKNLRKNQLFEMQKERETYNTKMNFFTNIAHEIQTPLSLIKGPIEWALSRIDDATTVQRNLELVNRNTDRLVQLTSELLDFRKMDTQQLRLKFIQTNVSDLLQTIVDNFESADTNEPVELTVHMPSTAVYAPIDREAFQKIMSNLISNATKYAEKSAEVNLYIDPHEPEFFKVMVINDGTPIPAESQKKIFEPFYRVPSRSNLRGTGIGLSFAKTLTEMHQGRLEYIASNTNLNIFELTLPLHQETTPTKAIENETIPINNR